MTIPQPSAFLTLVKGHDGECPAAEDHSSLQIEVAGADLLPTVSVISNSRELLSTDAAKSRYAYPRFRIEKSDSADRYG